MDVQTSGLDAPEEPQEPDDPATVPPVVAVVVTHDPGPWFDECLAGLAAQTYSAMSVLVIDAASAEDPTPRIARLLPGAYVRRLDTNPGYGAATNEALGMVDGAAFYLLCHDDVALDPLAVQSLVEETFRSNAGLVGPKLVEWGDPTRILDVGSAADKTGVVAPYAEAGELDQEQHDSVRDVFALASGCLLVRADLLAGLGGFDPDIDFVGEDLDLAWRAHIAGARVMVVPAARVRHREELAKRPPAASLGRLQARHRVRTMLTCYSPMHLLRVVPQAVAMTLVQACYALFTGRTTRARETVGAWTWNMRRLGSVLARRKALRPLREVPDRDLRRLQVRGSAQLRGFLRSRAGFGDDRISTVTRPGRQFARSFSSGPRRTALVVTVGMLILLVVSSRDLITDRIPAIGELAAFPGRPGSLLRQWLSGWRTSGLGRAGPQPTAFGLLGVLGTLMFGAMGALRKLLILGPLPLGALGAWLLARPIGSRRAAVVSFVVYVAIPVPYNALANGAWGGLLVYAAAPWLVRSLARATNLAPFATRPGSVDVLGPAGAGAALAAEAPKVTEAPASERYLIGRIFGLALLLALVASIVPFVLVVTLLVGAALVVGGLLAGRLEGLRALTVTAVAAPALALILHLPWSLELLHPGDGWVSLAGARSSQDDLMSVGRLLRFQSGPFGAPPLGWAVLVAAALPLLIGRGWRFEWAVRAWFVAIVSWGLLWLAHQGWSPVRLPPPEVLLAPAAIGLALAAALGMAAFEIDLPGYRFGWRQAVSLVAAAGVAVGSLTVFAGVIGGRWKMPSTDYSQALSFVQTERAKAPFRVLWVGDPEVLPLAGWSLGDHLSYATTDRALPSVEDRWAPPPDRTTGLIARNLGLAGERRTARLGRLLAPMGIRYLVLASKLGPGNDSGRSQPVPRQLLATLDQQLDLERVDVADGLAVYRNVAWAPTRAEVGAGTPVGKAPTDAGLVDLSAARNALPQDVGATGGRGSVSPGTVLLGSKASSGWQLTIDGKAAPRTQAWGWANQFKVDRRGGARLNYRTSPMRYLELAAQVLLWVLAFLLWRRFRHGPEARQGDPVDGRHP